MANRLQLRSGTTAQHNSFTGAVGEVTYDTDKKQIRVHDGVAVGGLPPTNDATETTAGKAKIATTAIAQAGINDTDIITAKKLAETVLGMGQTKKSLTIVSGTTYTNTSGRLKLISIKIANSSQLASIQLGDFDISGIGSIGTGGGAVLITLPWLNGEDLKVTFNSLITAWELS